MDTPNINKTRRKGAALLLFLLIPAIIAAQNYPRLSGRVVDQAGMISRSSENRIEEQLMDLERSDSTQIVVVTVNSLDGMDIESYSIGLAEEWEIGTGEQDNGAILLVSKAEREIRIEVGYGLEGSLTDLISGRIIRNIITPAFKNGNYDEGIELAVGAMVSTVKGEYTGSGKLPGEDQAAASGDSTLSFLFPLIMFMFFSGFFNIFRGGHRRRSGNFWLWALLGMSAGRHHRGYHGGFGGGSFGGGSPGGFSGGGGGFGGGGASGGW
ncbi:TPM domain-containing protein [Salinispira pacifica]|uniref:Beta-propeller domains of methanol dehydrogenase type n=1 Tax=Salinispira pacifica TaxID=1307761 RepID=V5WKG9_9SPIO|nr:TPM domain-containing protein [Salinispira pacifica]AHC15691.1 Beta-propeller domains of methanol dehydrogenase type [Salinispira pacifica]